MRFGGGRGQTIVVEKGETENARGKGKQSLNRWRGQRPYFVQWDCQHVVTVYVTDDTVCIAY